MGLTPKQEKFAQGVASGMTQADAYRAAYNCSRMKTETVQVAASNLMKDHKVSIRVEELRKPIVEAAQMTLEGHLEKLKALRDAAIEKGDLGSAIKAEVKRGEASGYYKTRTENQNQHVITYRWKGGNAGD